METNKILELVKKAEDKVNSTMLSNIRKTEINLILLEIQKEAINYSQCCTQLKAKEVPSFEDWIISKQIQKKGRLYFAKDGTEQDFNALHRRYVQTLQEQYF